MSQSPHSPDTQALLQSMLQRLRIQQGKDSETQRQFRVPNSAASACAEEAATEASSVQKRNTGPVDGYECGANRIHSKELRISETDRCTGLKGEVVQKTVLNWEVDKDQILFPAQNGNNVGGTGKNTVAGQNTQPRIPHAETGQPFPATLSKDGDITSYRSNVGTVNFGSMTVSIPEQTQSSQGFQPKVFAWSSKPTYVIGSPRYRVLPVENGEFGTSTPSKDTHGTATDQHTERGGLGRKQQSMEKKPRRWTQKIKERWKDRPGSFSKKQKEEQRALQIRQQSENSPQKQLFTTNAIINVSNKEEETVASPVDCGKPIKTAVTHAEDPSNAVNTRDFEFGLGSFSLLEEITSGQEWAKFLSPTAAPASADQRPVQEVLQPAFSTEPLLPTHSSNNQRGFRDVSGIQTWPGDFQPVSMDVSEEEQSGHRATAQMESVGHGQAPLDMRIGRQSRPLSFSQPADVQNNSLMKSRVQMNRKRHHHLTERTDKDPQTDAQHPDKEGFMSSWSSCKMGATGASQDDNDLPLNAYPPLSSSFFPPVANLPKGVLKHSVSQDSEPSVEILSKRRRVEENRHVRFSEEVVTIMPPVWDPDSSDPEEDSKEEEVFVQELEHEDERAEFMEMAPARRPALPAWIISLKNRNSQRKHRK